MGHLMGRDWSFCGVRVVVLYAAESCAGGSAYCCCIPGYCCGCAAYGGTSAPGLEKANLTP